MANQAEDVGYDEADIIEIETTKPTGGKRIPFRIGGEIYPFKHPKMHGLLNAVRDIKLQRVSTDDQVAGAVGMFDEVERWMFRCLDDDDATRLRDRLVDPDDEVDVDHIVQVFQALVEKVSGRSPTSPSA